MKQSNYSHPKRTMRISKHFELCLHWSNPLLFIQFEDYNFWNAAKRISTYWRMRKDTFGSRFLRPIHQTGNGALNPAAIKMLETGLMCPLPKASSTGHPVLCWDRDKLAEFQVKDFRSRAHVLFYMMQVMMTEVDSTRDIESYPKQKGQRRGFILLANFPIRFGSKEEREWSKKYAILVTEVFAIQISALHLIVTPTNRAAILLSGVIYIVTQIMKALLPSLVLVHNGTSVKEVLTMLRQVGFEKRNLPVKFGGIWKEEKFQQFLRRRRKIEEEMLLTTEEKMSRKRQVNMIQSRQKRERRKIDHEVLQCQCEEISKRNRNLQESIQRYERLIELAKATFEKYEANTAASTNCQVQNEQEIGTEFNGPNLVGTDATTGSQSNAGLSSVQSESDAQLQLLMTLLLSQQSSANQDILLLLNSQNCQRLQGHWQVVPDIWQHTPLLSADQIFFLQQRPQLVQHLLQLQQQQLSDLQDSQPNIQLS